MIPICGDILYDSIPSLSTDALHPLHMVQINAQKLNLFKNLKCGSSIFYNTVSWATEVHFNLKDFLLLIVKKKNKQKNSFHI